MALTYCDLGRPPAGPFVPGSGAACQRILRGLREDWQTTTEPSHQEKDWPPFSHMFSFWSVIGRRMSSLRMEPTEWDFMSVQLQLSVREWLYLHPSVWEQNISFEWGQQPGEFPQPGLFLRPIVSPQVMFPVPYILWTPHWTKDCHHQVIYLEYVWCNLSGGKSIWLCCSDYSKFQSIVVSPGRGKNTHTQNPDRITQ